MAIVGPDVSVNGDARIVTYSVEEDASPINPADASGGFGQTTYTTDKAGNTQLGDSVVLKDRYYGEASGTVIEVVDTDWSQTITADNALAQLSQWKTVPPFDGTLKDYLTMLKNLVKLDRDFTTNVSRHVIVPGFVGNVWEGFKNFLSANSLEVTSDFEVREIRSTEVNLENIITETTTDGSQESVDLLNVTWYKTNGWETNVEMFPFEDDFEPLSVNANETIEQEYTLNASLSSINQPVPKTDVWSGQNYTGTQGVYSVSGRDPVGNTNMKIEADRWLASGGWLRVELTDNPSVIKVIVHGGKVEEYQPYRIAMTAGDTFYNSLHVTGTGLRWVENSLIVHTGADRNDSDDGETPSDLVNINLVNQDMAYTAALKAARALNGGNSTVTGVVPTLGGFGEPLGSRVRKEHAVYRVSSQASTPENVSYTLHLDTTLDDYWKHVKPLTIQQFKERYKGLKLIDLAVAPLQPRRDRSQP